MAKKKAKKKSTKRKPSGGIFGILDAMELAKEGKSMFSGRAEITGRDYGPSHGQKPLKSVDLMYGKKLIMSGKDKGRII